MKRTLSQLLLVVLSSSALSSSALSSSALAQGSSQTTNHASEDAAGLRPPPLVPTERNPRLLLLASEGFEQATITASLQAAMPGRDVEPRPGPPLFLALDALLDELGPRDAALWFENEPSSDVGPSSIRVVVVDSDGVIQTRVVREEPSAMAATRAAVALLELSRARQEAEWGPAEQAACATAERTRREERQAARPEVPPTPWQPNPPDGRFRTHINTQGRFFRLGWVNGASPGHTFYGYGEDEGYLSAFPTGGVRLAVGRHFGPLFSFGGSLVTLHADGLWNGSVNVVASLHIPYRFRFGISLEIGLFAAVEASQNRASSLRYISPRIYVPLEFGTIVSRRGGFMVKWGPVVVATPTGPFIGYDFSVEWEFD